MLRCQEERRKEEEVNKDLYMLFFFSSKEEQSPALHLHLIRSGVRIRARGPVECRERQ